MALVDGAAELAARAGEACARGQRLRIRGGGTKDWYGEPAAEGSAETILDTRVHAGIVEYDPSELVITARCGTPLAELEAALAASGQMLACEPPHFGPQATVGGCVAAGLSGPRRATSGSVRDFVLGAKLINGRGQHLAFGGQVIKNVAGYDVSRLLAGSLGILGVITEVSLKVVPLPSAEISLRFDGIAQAEAIDRLNRWAGQPLPLSASAWSAGTLHLRLSGATAAVRAACAALGGERLEPAQASAFWAALREQSAPFFSGDRPLWRLSLPSVAPPLPAPHAQPEPDAPLLEWGGALRWLRSDAPADTLREAARAAGGHATLFRQATPAPGGSGAGAATAARRGSHAGCFAPLDPAVLRIHQRLKAEFDPAGVFNHGRLYPGL